MLASECDRLVTKHSARRRIVLIEFHFIDARRGLLTKFFFLGMKETECGAVTVVLTNRLLRAIPVFNCEFKLRSAWIVLSDSLMVTDNVLLVLYRYIRSLRLPKQLQDIHCVTF